MAAPDAPETQLEKDGLKGQLSLNKEFDISLDKNVSTIEGMVLEEELSPEDNRRILRKIDL